MTEYQPIACDAYDLYEIAIMRQQTLRIQWIDEQGRERDETVQPLDLKQFDGGEYLVFVVVGQNSGQESVRLDRILLVKSG